MRAANQVTKAELGQATKQQAQSGLEIELALQIKMAGLPKPVLQHMAVKAETNPPRKWRWDFAWIDERLLAEVDGGIYIDGAHARGSGIENDAMKQSTAASLGWRTMRFTEKMISDGRALALLETALAYGQEEAAA